MEISLASLSDVISIILFPEVIYCVVLISIDFFLFHFFPDAGFVLSYVSAVKRISDTFLFYHRIGA